MTAFYAEISFVKSRIGFASPHFRLILANLILMFLLALVGPDWLDLFLLLLIFLIGIYGYRQGPIYVIVSFLGALLGFVLGLLVGPPL